MERDEGGERGEEGIERQLISRINCGPRRWSSILQSTLVPSKGSPFSLQSLPLSQLPPRYFRSPSCVASSPASLTMTIQSPAKPSGSPTAAYRPSERGVRPVVRREGVDVSGAATDSCWEAFKERFARVAERREVRVRSIEETLGAGVSEEWEEGLVSVGGGSFSDSI